VIGKEGGELAERDDEVIENLLQLVVGSNGCTLAGTRKDPLHPLQYT